MSRTPHIDVVRRADALGIDAPWHRLLAVAIVSRAVLDKRSLDRNGLVSDSINGVVVTRPELEQFAHSKWCDALMQGVEGFSPEFLQEAAAI